MEKIIERSKQSVFSIFAMLITLLSFVLLSLQITFISVLWGFSFFFSHFSHKLTEHEVSHHL